MKTCVMSRRVVAVGLAASAVAVLAPRVVRAVDAAAGGRIVALGGAVTEILYALGCGDRVAAVDITSRFPLAATRKPNVGYYRQLSAEGVLALEPRIVVAADGAGPKEAVDVLQAASVRFVALEEVRGPQDISARIRKVAEAVGEPERGAELADAVAADLAVLAEDIARIPRRRRALALLGPSRGAALMAAGVDSTGGTALALAGCDNAASTMSGWKPLVDEAAWGLEPEAIVITRTSAPVSPEDVSSRPGLAQSPAVRENRVLVADALGFLGFGPRAAHSAREVAQRIYPETAFRALPRRPWTDEA